MQYLYITSEFCQTATQSIDLVAGEMALPRVPILLDRLTPLDSGKLAVLVKDDLMHPLRIELEERVPVREREAFLLWKLKRFLPYPTEQVALRFLELTEPNQFLTFSLPRTWIRELFDGLAGMGVHCGHIGGLFTTLLEHRPDWRDKRVLGLLEDYYMVAELEGGGRIRDFSGRRLPFDLEGGLDVNTLVNGDLAGRLQEETPLVVVNLAPGLEQAMPGLAKMAADFTAPIELMVSPKANALNRFLDAMGVTAGER